MNPAGRRFPALTIRLPEWVPAMLPPPGHRFASEEETMALVIALARRNGENGGGPFAAAVVSMATGQLVAPGVNQVVASRWSGAHAEIMALALAQKSLGTYNLAAAAATTGGDGYALFSSAEPCAMCLGAIPWSGVAKLVVAARDEDVRAIGFDEGLKPARWIEAFRRRGIQVRRDVLREEAVDVLRLYRDAEGVIYNG